MNIVTYMAYTYVYEYYLHIIIYFQTFFICGCVSKSIMSRKTLRYVQYIVIVLHTEHIYDCN